MAPMRLRETRERLDAFLRTDTGRVWVKVVRGVLIVAVVAFLIFKLSEVGWIEVWRARPKVAVFYVIVFGMYFILPIAEAVIYKRLWRVPVRRSFPGLLRKRVLNTDVMSYSGEVFLFLWARNNTPLTKREIAHTMKDNLLLSSLSSITAAALLLAGLWATGQLSALGRVLSNPSPLYVGGGVFVVVLVGLALVRFRRSIFILPRRRLAFVAVVHMTRFLVSYTLQVVQWAVVMPQVTFESWAILLSVLTILKRLPLLPSTDLLFVGILAELSPLLDIPVAPVVSMNLVRSALDRLLNLSMFGAATAYERGRRGHGRPVRNVAAAVATQTETPTHEVATASSE